MRPRPLPPFRSVQGARHRHDVASGAVMRPKPDRLKSAGLEVAAAVGRLARDPSALAAVASEVAVATACAANLLTFRIEDVPGEPLSGDPFPPLAEAAGRLADSCEKLDHLEDFGPDARAAVSGLAAWCVAAAETCGIDLAADSMGRLSPPAA